MRLMKKINNEKEIDMTEVSKLETMFKLQNMLNVFTAGPDWQSGIAVNGKLIYWDECMYQELAELVASFPWKHWKDVDMKADIINARIELVDVLFFGMSYILEDSKDLPSGSMVEYIIKTTVENIKHIPKDKYVWYENMDTEAFTSEVIDKVNDIRTTLSTLHMQGEYKSVNVFIKMYNEIFNLGALLGMTVDDIYKLYRGKLALNEFRQESGYKEGTYKKEWLTRDDEGIPSFKEDNMVMYDMAMSDDVKVSEFKAVFKELHDNTPVLEDYE